MIAVNCGPDLYCSRGYDICNMERNSPLFGCVYLAAVGGAAPYYAQFVKSAVCVAWPELAIEALWRYEVENLGPLLVSMDTHGHSYYEESDKAIIENARKTSAKLGAQAGRSLESPYMRTFHTTHSK